MSDSVPSLTPPESTSRSSSPGTGAPQRRVVSGSLRDRIAKFNNPSAPPPVPQQYVAVTAAPRGMIGNRIPSLDPKTAGIIGTGADKRVVENRGMIGNRIASSGSGTYSPLMGQSTGGSTGSGGSGVVPKPSPAAAPAAAPRPTSPAGSVDSSVASATVDSTISPITSRSSSPPSSPVETTQLPSSLVAATLPSLNADLGTSTPSSTRADAGDTVSELSLSIPSTPMGTTPPLSAPEYDLVPPNLKLASGGGPPSSGILTNPMVRGISQQSAGAHSLAGAFTPSISSSLATQSVGSEEETQMMADVSGVSTPIGTPRAARRELGEGSVVGEGSTAGDDVKDIESRLEGLDVADEANPAPAEAAAAPAEDDAKRDEGKKELNPPGGDVPSTPTVEKDEPLASSEAITEPQEGHGTPTKEPMIIQNETTPTPAVKEVEAVNEVSEKAEESEPQAPATPKSTASDPATASAPASSFSHIIPTSPTTATAALSETGNDKVVPALTQPEGGELVVEEAPETKEEGKAIGEEKETVDEKEEQEGGAGGDDERSKTLRRVKAQTSLRAAEVFGAGAGLVGAVLVTNKVVSAGDKEQEVSEPERVEEHVQAPAEAEIEVPAVDEGGVETDGEVRGEEIVVEHPTEAGCAAESSAAVPAVSPDTANNSDAGKEPDVTAPESTDGPSAIIAVGSEIEPSEVKPASGPFDEKSTPKQLNVESGPVAQPVVVAAETAPEDEVVQVEQKVSERKEEVIQAEAKRDGEKERMEEPMNEAGNGEAVKDVAVVEAVSAAGVDTLPAPSTEVNVPTFPDTPTADPDVEDPIPDDPASSTPATAAAPSSDLSPIIATGDAAPFTPLDNTMLKYFPEVPDEEKPRVEVHISSPAVTPQGKRRASSTEVRFLPGHSKSLSHDPLAHETPSQGLSKLEDDGVGRSSSADLEATPPVGAGKLGNRLSTRRTPKSPLLDDEDPGISSQEKDGRLLPMCRGA